MTYSGGSCVVVAVVLVNSDSGGGSGSGSGSEEHIGWEVITCSIFHILLVSIITMCAYHMME